MNKQPLSSITQEFTVRLHETDLGGIVHHSNYFHWIEETEYALFYAIGEAVVGELSSDMKGSGWPRAAINVQFLKPLKFRDRLRVELKIAKIRSAGIVYDVEINRLGDVEERVLQGSYTAICCQYDALQQSDPKVVPIADSFLEKICTYDTNLISV